MLIDEQTYAPGRVTERRLRLSEAIRIGAAMKPQCYGGTLIHGGSCALGAAIDGYGLSHYATISHIGVSIDVAQEIIRLNDHLHWTREQIADWLESRGL